ELAARLGVIVAGLMFLVGVGLTFVPPHSPSMLMLVAGFVFLAGQQELAAVRRREAARSVEPLDALPVGAETPEVEPAAVEAPFSGLAWDVTRRAWVIWHNGRPVASFGAKPE